MVDSLGGVSQGHTKAFFFPFFFYFVLPNLVIGWILLWYYSVFSSGGFFC